MYSLADRGTDVLGVGACAARTCTRTETSTIHLIPFFRIGMEQLHGNSQRASERASEPASDISCRYCIV